MGSTGGPDAPRRFLSDANWREPLRWDAAAAKAGERRRVFCGSMCDVFEDRPELERERARLWALIRSTPHLDSLLLTKRPENIARMLPDSWGDGWFNVWLGTSVGHPDSLNRLEHLRAVPAVRRFISAEPLLAPLTPDLAGIDWLIIGGESGSGARPMDLMWARSLIAECRDAGIVVFVKQLGHSLLLGGQAGPTFRGKGDDPSEWLRMQEFPVDVARATPTMVRIMSTEMDKPRHGKMIERTSDTTAKNPIATGSKSRVKANGKSETSTQDAALMRLYEKFKGLNGTEALVRYQRGQLIHIAHTDPRVGQKPIAYIASTFRISSEYARLHERVACVIPQDEFKAMNEASPSLQMGSLS